MNTTTINSKVSFLLLLFSFSLANICDADEILRVNNTTSQGINLWIWPMSANKWAFKKYIRQGGFENFQLSDLGSHYFMTKDDKNREKHLGWIVLSEYLPDADKKEIILGSEKKTMSREYTVQVPLTETVEQTYTVQVPVTKTRTVIRNGIPVEEKYTVQEPQTITRTVPVTKYRIESRVKEVTVELPTISVMRNGELQVIPGKFGRRTIGVGFEIVEDGMKIVSVKEGSPATNCRDGEGKVYALESGDVILSINGEKPTDTNRVLELIGDSRSDVEISVRDKDGKADRMLIVTPR